MDEIDRISREHEHRMNDESLRGIAHDLWVYYSALIDEGFAPHDALDIALSWQAMMMASSRE